MSLALVTLTIVDVINKSLRCTAEIDSCVLILCDTHPHTFQSKICVQSFLDFTRQEKTLLEEMEAEL